MQFLAARVSVRTSTMAAAAVLGLAMLLAWAAARPATAHAVIVPNESIAGIEIGMTRFQVRARLGAANHVSVDGNAKYWSYYRLWIAFIDGQHVTWIHTIRTREFIEGTTIHVGSTKAQVKAAFTNEHCHPTFCSLGPGGAGSGERYTYLKLNASNRVSRIDVGVVA